MRCLLYLLALYIGTGIDRLKCDALYNSYAVGANAQCSAVEREV